MRKALIAGALLAAALWAGPTLATDEFCGGIAGVQCTDAGEYCQFAPEAQCGAADQSGTCQPKPEVCTEQYDPVCGCDGQTYGNACQAAAAGVSVASAGECGATGEPGKKPKKDKQPKPEKGPKEKETPK
jgi:hypothetical protein